MSETFSRFGGSDSDVRPTITMSDSKTDVRLSFTPVRSEFVIESEIENFRQRLVGAENGKAKANTILSPRYPVKYRGRLSQADNLEVDLRFAFVNVVSFGPVNSSTLRVTMNAYNVSDTPICAEVIHEILRVDKTIAQITTSHEISSSDGTTNLSESDENANETTFKRDDVMEAISDSDILNIRSTIKIYTDDVSETKEDEENLIKTQIFILKSSVGQSKAKLPLWIKGISAIVLLDQICAFMIIGKH